MSEKATSTVPHLEIIAIPPSNNEQTCTLESEIPSQINTVKNNLKTELAQNILKGIPEEEGIIAQLDKTRVKWKDMFNNQHSTPAATKAAHDYYLNILAQVQTKVLASHDPLKTQLRRWEENFFLKNHQTEPQREDLQSCPEAYSLYKKLKICKQLLSHWKISLHMN